jgi:hypothetical protein
MRTFDGTGEYVRADDLHPGNRVRLQGEWHTVESVERYEFSSVRIRCEGGYESQTPATVRVLREVRP